tara:strand:+ start:3411 stop:4706 length:1296 start_codon:yes stop_codon:yes gene_type:complete
MKKLILIELNEINFDIVKKYIADGYILESFSKIIESNLIVTKSEGEYDNLEPWIQWPSVHTGLKYEEHNVFRLGDFINSNKQQFFEKVESAGYTVGAISPMNASNNLKKAAYFIPDPWTRTKTDGSFMSKSISEAVSQAVNDNSSAKITISSILKIGLAFLILVNPMRMMGMISYAFGAIKKPWRRALFLDKFLHEVHLTFFKRKKPNFSTLFLNAGAHIQHHYYYNSPYIESKDLENPEWYIKRYEDPFLEMLKVYDLILKDILAIPDAEIIVATGLSQEPYNYLKFYYRLKDHKSFLSQIDIYPKSVDPRMTRDFLITFNTKDEAHKAETVLENVKFEDGTRLFGEIDNRGNDLFVVLTYPNEIKKESQVFYGSKSISIFDNVTFVAIKNGEHQAKGFAYFSDGIKKYSPKNEDHVSQIHYSVLKYFNV